MLKTDPVASPFFWDKKSKNLSYDPSDLASNQSRNQLALPWKKSRVLASAVHILKNFRIWLPLTISNKPPGASYHLLGFCRSPLTVSLQPGPNPIQPHLTARVIMSLLWSKPFNGTHLTQSQIQRPYRCTQTLHIWPFIATHIISSSSPPHPLVTSCTGLLSVPPTHQSCSISGPLPWIFLCLECSSSRSSQYFLPHYIQSHPLILSLPPNPPLPEFCHHSESLPLLSLSYSYDKRWFNRASHICSKFKAKASRHLRCWKVV